MDERSFCAAGVKYGFLAALHRAYARRRISDDMTIERLAGRIGRSRQWVVNKMTGKSDLKLADAGDIALALGFELEVAVHCPSLDATEDAAGETLTPTTRSA